MLLFSAYYNTSTTNTPNLITVSLVCYSEFELVNMYVERNIKYYSCCEQPYPDITYTVHLRRRPMFYVFNMLLPCFLITLVALLGKNSGLGMIILFLLSDRQRFIQFTPNTTFVKTSR